MSARKCWNSSSGTEPKPSKAAAGVPGSRLSWSGSVSLNWSGSVTLGWPGGVSKRSIGPGAGRERLLDGRPLSSCLCPAAR
eukprot:1014504-Lingulodinium_polyedra.AAC.1